MSISIEFTLRDGANKWAPKNVVVNIVHDHKEDIVFEYLYVSI